MPDKRRLSGPVDGLSKKKFAANRSHCDAKNAYSNERIAHAVKIQW
jgi:hypothetical protein